jgi:hypothetical protein
MFTQQTKTGWLSSVFAVMFYVMSGHTQNVGLYNAGPPEIILVYSSIQQRINGAEKPIPSQFPR